MGRPVWGEVHHAENLPADEVLRLIVYGDLGTALEFTQFSAKVGPDFVGRVARFGNGSARVIVPTRSSTLSKSVHPIVSIPIIPQ
jgi:hypothetical protein